MASIDFVTLAEAKEHLRVDFTDEDSDIGLKLSAASRIVTNYLKSSADSFFDSSGDVILDSNSEPDVPYEVKAATLIMLGVLYRDRDGMATDQFEHGKLPFAVTSLLYPLRDPALE